LQHVRNRLRRAELVEHIEIDFNRTSGAADIDGFLTERLPCRQHNQARKKKKHRAFALGS
tara:strand:- start:4875 stop:5054 length:180 start_codon:yes stop_codon:yes gene_type:complete